MSTKTYKDFKFTVNQVKLMSQLYDSGLTADEVIAGFKQIHDMGGKSASPQEPTNENSQNGLSSTQPNNNSQNGHNQNSFSSPQPNNNNQSFGTPQRAFNSQQDFSFLFKTPTSVNSSSTPSMVFTPPSYTQPQGETPQGVAKSGKSRGRPKKPISNFVITEDDRVNFSPQVVALMEEGTVEVWGKINLLMKTKGLRIKNIVERGNGALSYSYVANWLKRPHTNDKNKVALVYSWYAEESVKGEENVLLSIENGHDQVEAPQIVKMDE